MQPMDGREEGRLTLDIIWHSDAPASTCSGGLLEKLWTALQTPSLGVVLLSEPLEREVGELMAATRLLRACGREHRLIVAATPHPSIPWLRRMRAIGTDRQWAVAKGCVSPLGVIGDSGFIEMREEPCTLLHTQVGEEGVLSVCKGCAGRMVLALPQFRRWCLTDPWACPYRRAFSPTSTPDSSPQPLS